MNLEAFLEKHSNAFRATIEAIPNNKSDVRLTPCVGLCFYCHLFSIDIPRELIAEVIPTEHTCRGKKVVEVSFQRGATIDLVKVFNMMFAALTSLPNNSEAVLDIGDSGGVVPAWRAGSKKHIAVIRYYETK